MKNFKKSTLTPLKKKANMKNLFLLAGNMQFITAFCAAAGLLFAFLYWQNNGLKVSRYEYEDDKIPQGFDGFKIAQISDFHNKSFIGETLVKKLHEENPEIIVITGDLIDSRKTDIPIALDLLDKLIKLKKPIYYVTGNHEARLGQLENFKKELSQKGVIIMDERKEILQRNQDFLTLVGVADPRFYSGEQLTQADKTAFRNKMLSFGSGDNTFKVLLAHRPEFIHTYRDSGINLALTGHAHGGQFGIPFTDKGLYVPNQGILPEFVAGMIKMDQLTEIISRGIGNSLFPFRLFNRPELVTVTFHAINKQ